MPMANCFPPHNNVTNPITPVIWEWLSTLLVKMQARGLPLLMGGFGVHKWKL